MFPFQSSLESRSLDLSDNRTDFTLKVFSRTAFIRTIPTVDDLFELGFGEDIQTAHLRLRHVGYSSATVGHSRLLRLLQGSSKDDGHGGDSMCKE
jgi:hypothetical protein